MRKGSTGGGRRRKRKGVLIVDAHPLIRERLADLVENENELEAVGEAADRHEALEIITEKRPDLVIAGLRLKNSDGLELIRDIHARWPKLPVLVLSTYEESLYAGRVLRAGARGYVNKQEPTQNVLAAIRRLLGGGLYFGEAMMARMVGRLAEHSREVSFEPEDALSERELQVFELTGNGLTLRGIADKLSISMKTVETYRTRIREKLGLRGGAGLLQLAIAWAHAGNPRFSGTQRDTTGSADIESPQI